MVYYKKNINKTLENPDLIPEEKEKSNSLSENGDDLVKQNKDKRPNDTSSEPEILINKNSADGNVLNNKSNKQDLSLFNRFLKEGFDGITTNPNYKLLALLIILLINLSLFLFVGNLGKSFLQNSGLLS